MCANQTVENAGSFDGGSFVKLHPFGIFIHSFIFHSHPSEGNIINIYLITGIISLINMQNFAERSSNVLNISVTDGVYTSFTRVKIEILPANHNNPVFPKLQIDVKVAENQPHGTLVTQVTANDKDFGIYGDVVYSISSELLRETFEIDKRTGNLGKYLNASFLFDCI
jgi:protocadherin Fat 1/2/3